MEAKQLLGLDVGQKHTGIARASSIAKLAEPLMSVDTTELMKTLDDLIKKSEVESIVVGLPRNLSGDDSRQTDWVRSWVNEAKPKIKQPLYWQDEALTSKLAALHQRSTKEPVDEHALAAAIILQDFLDTPDTERVLC